MRVRNLKIVALAVTLSLLPTIAHAGGTGPNEDNPVEVWYWCMAENIKYKVWKEKLEPDAAVAVAYRSCRSDFKAAMVKLATPAKQAAFRLEAKQEHHFHIEFATEMIKLGNPDDQQF
jgi:hypothetical protein